MKDITINKDNVSGYISRFLAGETSLAEERALYGYFRREKIPAELECYREMFVWYDSLRPAPRTAEPIRFPRLRRWQWTGVAATIALLLGLGFVFRMQTEASYIIRDGKKITDLRVVVPEIRRNEKLVSEQLRQIDMSIEEAESALDRALTEDFDMSDPTVAEVVETSLSY